ncbi:MAG TPA: tetratricopeptide repeat protein [Burkholderiales bacterium]|nr:tetratricopeptide repeat protein [Burkholderiales bacterium]
MSLPQALQIGLAHQAAGRLPQAEAVYRSILATDPGNADALHLLGTVAHHVGRHDAAVELIQQALTRQPANPIYLNNLANALRALGRPQEAEVRYRQALTLNPRYAHAFYNLGVTLEQLGRGADAESAYREAIGVEPNLAEAHYNLGNLLQGLKRFDQSRSEYEAVLLLRPQNAEAHNNLGNALKALDLVGDAERHYREAVRLKPDYAVAHYNFGSLLHDRGRLAEAERSYVRSLALNPRFPEAHYNLGNLLKRAGRVLEAEKNYRQALALKPEYPEASYNLGITIQALGRRAEAEACFRTALRLKPDYPEAHCLWIHERQHLCRWENLLPDAEVLRERIRNGSWARVFPFTFLALPETTAAEQHRCAQRFAEVEFRDFLPRPPLAGSRRRSRPKIRVGYLSADFHEHATSYLLPEVIERHDREHFEVHGYSHGIDDSSGTGRRVRAAFDVLRDLRPLDDTQAAQQILADEVDILVDLKGYTENSRVQICALRPAPVQVSWLGYPGTLGVAKLADYFVGDPVVSPLEHAEHYSERLALMPHCYQPNDARREIGSRPSRAEAGLPPEGFVFCSFNRSYKLTPAILDLWCALLRDVPGSVLWLLQGTPESQRNILQEAAKRGLDVQRLVFAPQMPPASHLGRLQLADLALDTFPVTSHTTASDALWAGVPLVARLGETFVSRVSSSIVTAAGLPELVTHDDRSYLELARTLATQPARLSKLRAKLEQGRKTCALFDSTRFVSDLEDLYRRMWDDHGRGRLEALPPRQRQDK